MSTAEGRIVRLRTFDWRDGSYEDEAWWVAIDDDASAVRAVMLAAATNAEDHGVEAVGRLSRADIEAAGLADGQAMRAPAAAQS